MKLLVTTDFSENSKGAIRFALALAKQGNNINVVFYHSIQILKPTKWHETFFNAYEDEEVARLSKELTKFINGILGRGKTAFKSIKYVVDSCLSTDEEIVKFAEDNKVDFICIATQGGGMLRKIMGTHTTYIVNNSKVPVLVIPSHYKPKPIDRITYLADFENLKSELQKVNAFSEKISSKLEVLHYSSVVFDEKKFETDKALFNTKKFAHVKLSIQKNNLELSLVKRISKFVDKSRPALLVMFTTKERSFFESLFLPSSSAELTYSTKVPVLIYSK